jgi:hypothetical protein
MSTQITISGSGPEIKYDLITSSSVWTKPNGAKKIEVHIVSGGGGGGSGFQGAVGVNRYGGGGGSAGSICIAEFLADVIPSSVNVWIGSGGLGAPGQTTANSNGVNGGGGSASFFGGSGTASTSIAASSMNVPGGAGGQNASNTGGSNAPSSINGIIPVSYTYAAGTRNSQSLGGSTFEYSTVLNAGSWGGGITSAGVSNGGSSTRIVLGSNTGRVIIPPKSTAPGANGVDGSFLNSQTSAIPNYYYNEGGAGGGAGTDAGGAAGRGGNGAIGAGGGGGGASVNGVTSGAGGNGGNGFCFIITYF